MITMNNQSSYDDLVKKLKEVPFKRKLSRSGHPSTYADDLKLLHELQVQQLEMELHNLELRSGKLTLEDLNKKQVELFEFAPNGYFTLLLEGNIREVNLTGSDLLGKPKSQLIHQLIFNFIHPEDLETMKVCWCNLIETRDFQVFKARLPRPDGQQLFVRIALTFYENVNGSYILLAMKDVTLVKKIEEAQQFLLGGSWAKSGMDFFCSLAKYLSKNLGMTYVSIDRIMDSKSETQSMAVYWEDQFQDNSRCHLEEIVMNRMIEQKSFCYPSNVRQLFPHDITLKQTRAESYSGVALWGSEGKPIGLIRVIGHKPLADPRLTEMVLKQVSIRAAAELEHRQLEEAIIQSRDELEALVHKRTAELQYSNEKLRNEIDIRQQHELALLKAENILLDSQKHLRQLTQRMDAIAEEERTRIAREIHDELGHLLTSLKNDMDMLINQSTWSMKTVKSEVGEMMDMVDSLIDSVRKIATDLRPGILDHLGLFPAVEWQINQFRMRTKIGCTFSMGEVDVLFDKNQTTIVYRILQEILTNITRHSQAKHVSVNLSITHEDFMLKVSDNGIGFEPDESNRTNSLGLMGMQERALSIGGELQIDSTPGKGTSIIFLLPKVNVSCALTEP